MSSHGLSRVAMISRTLSRVTRAEQIMRERPSDRRAMISIVEEMGVSRRDAFALMRAVRRLWAKEGSAGREQVHAEIVAHYRAQLERLEASRPRDESAIDRVLWRLAQLGGAAPETTAIRFTATTAGDAEPATIVPVFVVMPELVRDPEIVRRTGGAKILDTVAEEDDDDE